ncbi:MAG TPA: NAD(P)-binding domain-containing protein, partial [Acidiferrobacteraceae bacterium]|nr:NAD(P)-binding domain-containing protein [Acidiferrobacteraceae bacterium]
MQTGWIGLGGMGEAMARRLAERGLLARAWNRTPARAVQALAGLDVPLAPSAAELARDVRLLFLSLADDAAVHAVVDSIEPVLAPGTLIIDTSTTAPATSRMLARRLALRQVRF